MTKDASGSKRELNELLAVLVTVLITNSSFCVTYGLDLSVSLIFLIVTLKMAEIWTLTLFIITKKKIMRPTFLVCDVTHVVFSIYFKIELRA